MSRGIDTLSGEVILSKFGANSFDPFSEEGKLVKMAENLPVHLVPLVLNDIYVCLG